LISDLFRNAVPVLEEALKKNDWQKIREISAGLSNDLPEETTDIEKLLEEIRAMDGRTGYLSWHNKTNELCKKLSAKAAMLS
jgi:hypothetical protein